MRRHAKAMSAGSNSGQASRLGSFLRGASVTRGATYQVDGSAAPSPAPARRRFALISLISIAALTLTATPALAAQAHVFSSSFGGSGSGNGQFALAQHSGAAVNATTGNLYVADTDNGRVQEFNAAGTFVRAFGTLAAPTFVAVDNSSGSSAGDVYVADRANATIYKFDGNGALLTSWGTGGALNGSALNNGPFGSIAGIAVDATGTLYVYNEGAQIFKFTQDGTFITDFNSFFGVTPAGIAVDSSGNLYVVRGSGAVAKLNPSGGILVEELDPGPTTGLAAANADIYIAHPTGVNRYDSLAAPVESFGSDDLTSAAGLAVGDDGTVYVAEAVADEIDTFVLALIPDTRTDGATAISRTIATLHGTVSAAGGPDASCQFQYTTDGSFQAEGFKGATSVPCAPSGPFTGTSANPVKADLSGLSIATTYRFRVVGTNENGANPGLALSFETTGPVSLATGTASNITPAGATLNGTINPEGVELDECFFEFGETESYGQTVPCVESPAAVGNGAAVVPVHANVSGLTPNTLYHFRVAARNSLGENKGVDSSFFSSGPPRIKGESFYGVTVTEATVTGLINPSGEATSYVVEYVSDEEYESSEYDNATSVPLGGEAIGASTDYTEATQLLTGLTPGTTYHFRLVATNAAGPPVQGPGTFFTTLVNDTGLPDGRAYEMVSPAAKTGEVFPPNSSVNSCPYECLPGINSYIMPMQGAPSGNAVLYQGQPFFTGYSSAPNEYLSGRTASGWKTQSFSLPVFGGSEGQGFQAFSSDLSRGVLYQALPAVSPDAPADYPNLYLRNADGSLRPLVTETPPHRSPGRYDNRFVIAHRGSNAGTPSAPAFSHVIFTANDALTEGSPGIAPAAPEIASGENCYQYAGENCNIYEWVDGQLRLVNVLPGNATAASGPVVGSGSLLGQGVEYENTQVDHAISADGRRIFWSDGSGQAYVRIDGTETREIKDSGIFLDASVDGSKVLLNDGCLYDLQTEACEDLTKGQGGFQGILGASEDFSRVYFVDTAEIPGSGENDQEAEAQAGENNLYAWDEGVVSFVTTLGGNDNAFFLIGFGKGSWKPSFSDRTAQVSPDGRYLAFMSRASLTGYDNSLKDGGECRGSGSSACTEVFEYDAVSANLTCASCNPTGQRPLGPGLLSLISSAHANLPQPGNLTTDGEGRLFFESQDVLAVGDVNGHIQDVYQWEPDGVGSCRLPNGCISLISSGKSSNDSHFLDASPSGNDVFIVTREQLVIRDKDQQLDLYDARVGGGFDESEQPPCLGEACKGPNSSAPAQQSPGSSTFNGPNNQKQKAQKHKKRHKKKQKKQKKQRHQKRSAKHNSGGSK